jgi:hypothetical protein
VEMEDKKPHRLSPLQIWFPRRELPRLALRVLHCAPTPTQNHWG